MRPVLTAAQARQQDSVASTPAPVLLERAGLAVSLVAAELGAGYGARVAVLCGPGNNGGDGYVAARLLRRRGGWVEAYSFGEPSTTEAQAARDLAFESGVEVGDPVAPRPADLVVDALFGAGFRGDLPDLEHWRHVPSVAVDVPSGLDATTGVAAAGTLSAAATVTFHGPKLGHLIGDGPDLVGSLRVADIGLPDVEPEMWLCESSDAPVPVRARTAHKWSAGSVLVVGGSHGLDGAPTLAARAALRAGAGAVMLVCPASVEDRVRAPEIMTRALGETGFGGGEVEAVVAMNDRFDTLVLGPGLGADVREFVIGILGGWPGKVVLDADALNALTVDDLGGRGELVITPHAGEFTRLTGATATYDAARSLAAQTGRTVLLKGAPTFVMSPGRSWVVTSGGRELATAGSGDVLAGTIAALWGAGLDGHEAALSGAFWHGMAGADLASNRRVTADALADHVGVVLAGAPRFGEHGGEGQGSSL